MKYFNTHYHWKNMLLLQAIIHPDTGEKILMPFRMSGTVTGWGSFGGRGIQGVDMRSNIEELYTVWTVTTRWGSSGCPGKVTLSWMLIKICPPPRWSGLWVGENHVFWSRFLALFVTGMLEITNYGEGPDQHYVRDEWESWWSHSLSFNRVYPLRYTSGKSPFIHFHPLMSVYSYNLLYISKRCFLVVQVVGLLLPNQSLLSTVFWQVNSTYYL